MHLPGSTVVCCASQYCFMESEALKKAGDRIMMFCDRKHQGGMSSRLCRCPKPREALAWPCSLRKALVISGAGGLLWLRMPLPHQAALSPPDHQKLILRDLCSSCQPCLPVYQLMIYEENLRRKSYTTYNKCLHRLAHTYIHTFTYIHRSIDPCIHACMCRGRKPRNQTDRQTDRQTDGQTDSHKQRPAHRLGVFRRGCPKEGRRR